MGLRAAARDILIMYIMLELFRGYLFGDFTISVPILVSAIIISVFVVWFWLERFGIIPKLM